MSLTSKFNLFIFNSYYEVLKVNIFSLLIDISFSIKKTRLRERSEIALTVLWPRITMAKKVKQNV